jgi:hypothetical protein
MDWMLRSVGDDGRPRPRKKTGQDGCHCSARDEDMYADQSATSRVACSVALSATSSRIPTRVPMPVCLGYRHNCRCVLDTDAEKPVLLKTWSVNR